MPEKMIPDLPDVEDDDPDRPDDVRHEPQLTKDTNIRELLSLGDADGAPADDDEPAEPAEGHKAKVEEPPAKEEPPPAETPPTKPVAAPEDEPKFSQRQLETILAERLGRDRKTALVRDLERLAGKPIEQVLAAERQRKAQELADSEGISAEKAAEWIAQQEELARLKSEREQAEQERQSYAKARTYDEAKQKFLADSQVPADTKAFARKYAAEIDAFANNGLWLDFDLAVHQVLGQKLPEILAAQKAAAEQRVLRNVTDRAKAAPEKEQPSSETEGLTSEQRHMAAALGINPKAYAAQLARSQRAKRR